MDATIKAPIEWPNVGDVVQWINDDGSTALAVIKEVISRGDYPIARLGLFKSRGMIDAYVQGKFDPDADRPGTWHR